MTISRKTLNNGFIIGLGTAFVAIIGMIDAFSERYIVTELITLSQVILLGVFLAAGAFNARNSEDESLPSLAANGAIAAAIVAAVMLGVALIGNQVNIIADEIDMTQVFPNVTEELLSTLSFGQESAVLGFGLLIVGAAVLGAVGALLTRTPAQARSTAMLTLITIMVLGMLQDQVNTIITLPDALLLAVLVMGGYGVATWRGRDDLLPRLLESTLAGVIVGVVIGVLLLILGANAEAVPALLGGDTTVLNSFILGRDTLVMLLLFGVLGAVLGLVGGVLSSAPAGTHRIGVMVLMAVLVLGILHSTEEMTIIAAIIITVIMVAGQYMISRTAQQSGEQFEQLPAPERRTSQVMVGLAGLAFALVLPQFLTGYINNVVDLVGLYVMMGLGLNIVVGFAGLLDLGYVAFFAIGAYMTGILTTPNVLTCGGISPADIDPAAIEATCTGITTFWLAWPAAILTSGFAGVLLGIPVLRLRGDYLAIVTLGFGEIIRLLALSDLFKPYFGGAQGITDIPSPIIDFTGISEGMINSGLPLITQLGESFAEPITLARPNEIYYLILAGIIVTAFVSYRLSRSRLGRSWRAMKEDEDVAQAMGVNLVRTKLLAFSIGAAFSGVGGAIFGSYLKSIFPNSFTLLISINVLSLIIIGGMGSLPGVFIGALVIFGLPEALREFQDYRLLMFGALLVITMLLRPEGLLPPSPPKLEEQAEKAFAEEGA